MVVRWTGRETRVLRLAQRMTVRTFAAAIGVSDRMVSKWEKGGATVEPRPANQAALDTMLALADKAVQERFATLITEQAAATADPRTETLLSADTRIYRTHPVDGKVMVQVEEGIYLAGPDDEPVWLSGFWIDVFPTTNADYARYLTATSHTSPRHWSPEGHSPEALFDHPVVWVDWHDATAYARWAHKTLPTSAQWEKAARGPKGSTYPWGEAATAAKANVRESGITSTTPVSRYRSGASPYGVYDLCGNTWEWTSSQTRPGRYELKGSAFTSPFEQAAPSAFNDACATMADDDTGFRCAALAVPPGA
ncbi:SUMF1/EgtB/PvdO family nonheme iron enzyme [Streptomyces sp. CBMA152]|uniref:SUMF1/EgtB/PvdO family nonheme iron enzyme n=1 Tax=Streptomyces sp. CBMA152 TaxID=1896312 RepID=UPI001CB6DC99|nr:SUMF1/EgtB/PvdO family nonheme iron enzyme [Streptomyces sp. CBMA152]MBD0744955.1 DNA-binding protein [Streptomyces sp. CBMA152]